MFSKNLRNLSLTNTHLVFYDDWSSARDNNWLHNKKILLLLSCESGHRVHLYQCSTSLIGERIPSRRSEVRLSYKVVPHEPPSHPSSCRTPQGDEQCPWISLCGSFCLSLSLLLNRWGESASRLVGFRPVPIVPEPDGGRTPLCPVYSFSLYKKELRVIVKQKLLLSEL